MTHFYATKNSFLKTMTNNFYSIKDIKLYYFYQSFFENVEAYNFHGK